MVNDEKKYVFSMMLALVISISSILSANAIDATQQTTTVDFGSIISQAAELEENGASQEDVINFYASQGVTVQDVTSVYVDKEGNEFGSPASLDNGMISPMSLDPMWREVTNWTGSSGGYYYSWVKVRAVPSLGEGYMYEFYPASYDVLTLSWDPTYLTYSDNGFDTGSLSHIWLSDADYRLSGTLLWSMDDNPVESGKEYVQAWVKLSKKKAGSTTTAVKYTHTYDSTSKSTSTTGNASWTWGSPLTVGVSYTVNTTTTEKNWSKAATANMTVN